MMKTNFTRYIRLFAFVLFAAVLTSGCGGPRGGGSGQYPEIVKGGVIFKYYDRDATAVYLVGDFNNWSPKADPLSDENSDGEWSLFYSLGPGTYEYKFVVNGREWVPDPRNPDSVPDGFEGRNSVVKVPNRIF